MDEARWAALQAKRERNAYFLGLERAAQEALYRPTPKPKQDRTTRAASCAGCARPFRPNRALARDYPGTVRHEAGNRCKPCKLKADGRVRKIGAPRVWGDACVRCERKFRPWGAKHTDHPGMPRHEAHGMCSMCLKRAKKERV